MMRPKAVSCADLVGVDLQNAGLIHGSGEDAGAGNLFHRHRLAGDVGLIDKGMAADDHAIHGNVTARPHQHDVANVHVPTDRAAPLDHPTALPRSAAADPAIAGSRLGRGPPSSLR